MSTLRNSICAMDASLSGSYCCPATYIPTLAEMVCPGPIVNTLLGAGKTLWYYQLKRKTEEVKPIKEVSGAWVTTLI